MVPSLVLQDPPPEDLGAGCHSLRVIALSVDRGLRDLRALLCELEVEEPGRRIADLNEPFDRVESGCAFFYQGGDVPRFLTLRRTFHVAGGFASEVRRFVGSFLVTKQGSGPPRPRRAAWAIRGISGGRVALQRLPACASDDADVRKLGVPDAAAPGGFSADPVEIQRLCWMVTQETLVSWGAQLLVRDLPQCLRLVEHTLSAVKSGKQRRLEAARAAAEYERHFAYLQAWRRQRGPLVRELWAALWNSHTGRAQSVFFAMKRIGIFPTHKIFHVVTVPETEGEGQSHVVLEPAGAIAEEANQVLDECDRPVRSHAVATALEAYECIRLDNKAPAGRADLQKWLQQECGPPTRTQWDVQRFQQCPGRHMMLNQIFEQLTLTDLIADALEVEIPVQENSEKELAQEEEKEPELLFAKENSEKELAQEEEEKEPELLFAKENSEKELTQEEETEPESLFAKETSVDVHDADAIFTTEEESMVSSSSSDEEDPQDFEAESEASSPALPEEQDM